MKIIKEKHGFCHFTFSITLHNILMKKICISLVAFAMVACGGNGDHGHNHDKAEHENHAGHEHKGHGHDDHKGHDHNAHKGHNHEGHDHHGHDHGEHASVSEKHFGAMVNKDNSTSVAMAISSLGNEASKEVKIYGKITEVCQKKGCWITLENKDGEDIWVKFKDYGFFAPMNAAGEMGTFNGVLSVEEQSVEELQHYAEDAGKSKEEIAAITKPKRVYSFMVDGFVLD